MFGTFVENTAYLAESLLHMGLKDRRIMIFGENSVEWMMADLAIMSYVGTCIGVDKEWKREDIRRVLGFLQVDAVIYSDSKREIMEDLASEFTGVQCFSMQRDIPELLSRGKELASRKNNLFDFPHRDSEACARVVFTSGTTSFPKAVMLSEKNIFAGWNSLMKRASMDETDRCYLFLPLHHTYAGIYNFVYSLISGMKIYLSSGVGHIAEELPMVQPTVFCAVPLIYRRFYDGVEGDICKLPGLFGGHMKYLFCGGAYLEEPIRKAYRDAGLNLLIAYALSETASSFSIEYSGSLNLQSVGTVFEDLDVKIDAPDEAGEGEILVKGDAVFLGYMNNPEATALAFNGEGYFRTGDVGFVEKNNDLYLTGRKRRILLTDHGENIYPNEIEQRLALMCDQISSVKVYMHDAKLKANIYIKSECAVDFSALVEALNRELSKTAEIRTFEVFVDSVDRRMKQ